MFPVSAAQLLSWPASSTSHSCPPQQLTVSWWPADGGLGTFTTVARVSPGHLTDVSSIQQSTQRKLLLQLSLFKNKCLPHLNKLSPPNIKTHSEFRECLFRPPYLCQPRIFLDTLHTSYRGFYSICKTPNWWYDNKYSKYSASIGS